MSLAIFLECLYSVFISYLGLVLIITKLVIYIIDIAVVFSKYYIGTSPNSFYILE
jgi:hypothetical protein